MEEKKITEVDPTIAGALPSEVREVKTVQELDKEEPILKENGGRFVLFPIQHNDIWEMYKKSEASFWTAEEIDLAQDMADWENKLNDNERFFIKNV